MYNQSYKGEYHNATGSEKSGIDIIEVPQWRYLQLLECEAKYKYTLKLLYEAWSRIECDHVADFIHANLKDLEE